MQAMDLIPLLTQTIDRAVSQQTQVSVVSEGVAAACLLVKLAVADIQAGTHYTQSYILAFGLGKKAVIV